MSALSRDERQRTDLADLVRVTDAAARTGSARSPAIGPEELVAGVPFAHIVNAAFLHASPLGGRFNSAARGAWYCAFDLETAVAEVVFHKTVEFAEIGRFSETAAYVDHLADFSAAFHDLRAVRRYRKCLDPDDYVASQSLANQLLADGSLGIVYPSVRHAGGTCIACFRPALVGNVRRGMHVAVTWLGAPDRVRVSMR